MKKVEQISIDILYNEGSRPTCAEIEKILSMAGVRVLGLDYTSDLAEMYKNDYPELLED